MDLLSRHYLTVGAGVAIPAAGYKLGDFHNSPVLSANYEFRFSRYLGAETGFDAIFGRRTISYRFVTLDSRTNAFLLPFGFSAHLPVRRFELSAGVGGARIQYSGSDLCCNCCGLSYNSWLVQTSASLRLRLDAGGRYRVGVSARHYRDVGSPTQQ